jgi:isoleucyl-tRNA synthetase
MEGFSAASDGEITVGLSLKLDQDLIYEGLIRDLVRTVQNMRKEAGYAVEDRIDVSINLNGESKDALVKFEHYFKTETLVLNILEKIPDADFSGEIKIGNESYNIVLKKAK